MSENISEIASEETGGENPPVSPEDDFAFRVGKIAEMLKDEEQMRKCIAEIYIFLSDMDTAIRGMMTAGGPMKILSNLMGKKVSSEDG